jgi:hypothetical protein
LLGLYAFEYAHLILAFPVILAAIPAGTAVMFVTGKIHARIVAELLA